MDRPRIDRILDRSLDVPLTVVSAPAGFGKSSAVAGWLERGSPWTNTTHRGRGFSPTLLRELEDVGFPATETDQRRLLTLFLNELAELPENLVLVLDDYHLASEPGVDSILAFLFDYLPPPVHLIVVTREDPPIALPLLRARGRLLELRAEELRFAKDEVEAFVTRRLGGSLSPAELGATDRHTEGWIAGLQMATLAVAVRSDISRAISELEKDTGYILGFFIEEVIMRLPADRRRFLLRISVGDRFTVSLAEALSEEPQAEAVLASLERDNLFLISLDDRREWYRYHNLFRDTLRAGLERRMPEGVAKLHRRTVDWMEATGNLASAVEHALAAGETIGVASGTTLYSRPAPTTASWRTDCCGNRLWLLLGAPGILIHGPILGQNAQ